MFGISAFAQTPFASIPSVTTPVPVEIPLGGHFGFDEKKRDAQWDKEKKLEAQRKLKLQEALFGLPPEVREEITTAPAQTIEVAVRNQIDYDLLMQRVKALEVRVKLKRDEEDVAMILELM